MIHLAQHARAGLAGPAFLDFVARFPREEISVLHSGHNVGLSVLARRPLITITANPNASAIHVETTEGLPPIHFPSEGDILQQWQSAMNMVQLDSLHHLLTGWIGYISYDIARTLENIGDSASDDLHCPLLHWRLFAEYYLFDHGSQTWTLVAPNSVTSWSSMERQLHPTAGEGQEMAGVGTRTAQNTGIEALPRDQFLRAVERIKDYIAAGDIFQANYAQRWKIRTGARPTDVFSRLMQQTPAQYAALIVHDNRAIISASPELLLHRAGRAVVTRPIKGTRPRNVEDLVRDEALREELVRSEKDKAELAMIVDLLRNDLGRIAEYGSVNVTTPREIEQLPTLWHAVATIQAELADQTPEKNDPRGGKDWASILRALMPGGSVTGAPKIRAMQIIEELERTRRGVYCGSIGCIGQAESQPAGMLNIAIRTIQMVGDIAYVHAGAGIVADSSPEHEYEETLHKAAAMLRALGVTPSP